MVEHIIQSRLNLSQAVNSESLKEAGLIVSCPLTETKCVTCTYKWAGLCFLCSTLIFSFSAAAIISVGICKLRRMTDHFRGFHHPTFIEKRNIFITYVTCFLPSPAQTASCAAPCCLAQYKYCTYKYRHIQNSLTLSIPLPLPSLLCTQTHMHTRFSAICMHQYEGITQARKGKDELDYSGSLWHEKPTDKFLSPHYRGKNRTVKQPFLHTRIHTFIGRKQETGCMMKIYSKI